MNKLNCILLVDDNPDDNFFHEIILKKAGIAKEIKAVENGRDAIQYLKNEGSYKEVEKNPPPNLIFLDINMPVMDAWQFLDEYKKNCIDKKNQFVIIMLSTSLNPLDKERAEKIEHITEFINKPLTVELALSIVDNYFNH